MPLPAVISWEPCPVMTRCNPRGTKDRRPAFREKEVNDLKSTADLPSSNANSALGYGDSEAGNQIVEAMRVRPGIRTAIINCCSSKSIDGDEVIQQIYVDGFWHLADG